MLVSPVVTALERENQALSEKLGESGPASVPDSDLLVPLGMATDFSDLPSEGPARTEVRGETPSVSTLRNHT